MTCRPHSHSHSQLRFQDKNRFFFSFLFSIVSARKEKNNSPFFLNPAAAPPYYYQLLLPQWITPPSTPRRSSLRTTSPGTLTPPAKSACSEGSTKAWAARLNHFSAPTRAPPAKSARFLTITTARVVRLKLYGNNYGQGCEIATLHGDNYGHCVITKLRGKNYGVDCVVLNQDLETPGPAGITPQPPQREVICIDCDDDRCTYTHIGPAHVRASTPHDMPANS